MSALWHRDDPCVGKEQHAGLVHPSSLSTCSFSSSSSCSSSTSSSSESTTATAAEDSSSVFPTWPFKVVVYDQSTSDSQQSPKETEESTLVSGRDTATTVDTSAKGTDFPVFDNSFWHCLNYFESLCCLAESEDAAYAMVGCSALDALDAEGCTDNVVVAVEAIAIRDADRGAPSAQTTVEDENALTAPGCNGFVGLVHRSGPGPQRDGFVPGARVATVVGRGRGFVCDRYVSVSAKVLMSVPTGLDAADMACVVSTYLPAFQALHHGRKRPYRYSKSCLDGRRVLVVTGGGDERTDAAAATARLARMAGASDVLVVAGLPDPRLRRGGGGRGDEEARVGGATLLPHDPDAWLPIARGKMDVVVDYRYPENFSHVRSALSRRGRLVCVARREGPPTGPGGKWLSAIGSLLGHYRLSAMQRATLFDFDDSARTGPGELRDDAQFLLRMLTSRQIRPQIDKFVGLKDLATLHKEFQTRAANGAIICEPWKD